MQAARHDFAVFFHGNLLTGERHLLDQRADRQRLLEALRRAVHRHLDHFRSMIRYSPSITRPCAGCTARTGWWRARHHNQVHVNRPSASTTATSTDVMKKAMMKSPMPSRAV